MLGFIASAATAGFVLVSALGLAVFTAYAVSIFKDFNDMSKDDE